jgi:chemotaxis protein MotB
MNYYEVDDYPQRRQGRGFTIALVLLVLLLGAATWFLWKTFRRTDHELTSSRAKVVSLENASRAAAKRLSLAEAERDRLTRANADLEGAKERLAAVESKLGGLQAERAEMDARMAEFRDISEKFKSLIDAGTLQITFRRGRAIVTLPAGVLFDSGSAELSTEGARAVTEVARVLRGVPRRRFIVAGHTDNVPAVKEYKSNWALSTARAVTVLEALVRAGMGPTNLSASGFAEFDPVASNGSPEGRQKNRRIEIALEPFLAAPPKER